MSKKAKSKRVLPLTEFDEFKATPEEIQKAIEVYGSDDVEVDTDARASRSDEGVWVQGWLWLPKED